MLLTPTQGGLRSWMQLIITVRGLIPSPNLAGVFCEMPLHDVPETLFGTRAPIWSGGQSWLSDIAKASFA